MYKLLSYKNLNYIDTKELERILNFGLANDIKADEGGLWKL